MEAPMRRPVKEPGPDIKVISSISCHVLCSVDSFSLMKLRSFSASELPNSYWYSVPSSLSIVVGVEVSKYTFIG